MARSPRSVRDGARRPKRHRPQRQVRARGRGSPDSSSPCAYSEFDAEPTRACVPIAHTDRESSPRCRRTPASQRRARSARATRLHNALPRRRGRNRWSVRFGPYGLDDRSARLPALQAFRRCFGRQKLLVRKDADGGLRLVLDLCLAVGATAPACVDETALPVHELTEVVIADAMANAVLLATLARGNQHVLLQSHQQLGNVFTDRVERHRTLLAI